MSKVMRKVGILAPLLALAMATCLPVPAAVSGEFDDFHVIKIENGSNRLRLLGHPAEVFRALRPNGNAHDFDVATVYMQSSHDDGFEGSPIWLLVPLFGKSANGNGERFEMTASYGADCMQGDFRFLENKSGTVVRLVVGYRELGKSFADPAKTHFDFYTLRHNVDSAVGWPPYYFQFDKRVDPKKEYCDIEDAFAGEWKIK